MRCALGRSAGRGAPRPRARAAADRRPRTAATAARARARAEPYTVGTGPRVVLARPRLQALDLRAARRVGLQVVVVPGDWDADAVLELEPRAVLVGNGPGDPAQLDGPVETVRDLLGRMPLFGICLGHQLARARARAANVQAPVRPPRREPPGARTGARPRARHGPEPRLRRRARRRAEVSHVSLNDGTVEGLEGDGFATLQFHPEAAPGPLDALPFFDRIAEACRSARIFAAS